MRGNRGAGKACHLPPIAKLTITIEASEQFQVSVSLGLQGVERGTVPVKKAVTAQSFSLLSLLKTVEQEELKWRINYLGWSIGDLVYCRL